MPNPQLNQSTKGVDFDFVVESALVKGHVSHEALEDHFSAGSEPQTWLQAFRANEDRIVEVARDRLSKGALEPVVVATVDL